MRVEAAQGNGERRGALPFRQLEDYGFRNAGILARSGKSNLAQPIRCAGPCRDINATSGLAAVNPQAIVAVAPILVFKIQVASLGQVADLRRGQIRVGNLGGGDGHSTIGGCGRGRIANRQVFRQAGGAGGQIAVAYCSGSIPILIRSHKIKRNVVHLRTVPTAGGGRGGAVHRDRGRGRVVIDGDGQGVGNRCAAAAGDADGDGFRGAVRIGVILHCAGQGIAVVHRAACNGRDRQGAVLGMNGGTILAHRGVAVGVQSKGLPPDGQRAALAVGIGRKRALGGGGHTLYVLRAAGQQGLIHRKGGFAHAEAGRIVGAVDSHADHVGALQAGTVLRSRGLEAEGELFARGQAIDVARNGLQGGADVGVRAVGFLQGRGQVSAVFRRALGKGIVAAGGIEVQHAVVGDHELVAALIAVAIDSCSFKNLDRFGVRGCLSVNGLADSYLQSLAAVLARVVQLAPRHTPGILAVAEPGHAIDEGIAFGIHGGSSGILTGDKIGGGGRAVLLEGDAAPAHERDIVGALDVDRHRLFHGAALAVRHTDGKGQGFGFPFVQAVDGGGGIVQIKVIVVGDAAVIIGCGRKHQVAVSGVVGSCATVRIRAADDKGGCIIRAVRKGQARHAQGVAVHIVYGKAAGIRGRALGVVAVSAVGKVGAYVAALARFRQVKGDVGRGLRHRGRVVGAVDGDGSPELQLAVRSIGIIHHNAELYRPGLAVFQRLHRLGVIVQLKRVLAVIGVEVERAVLGIYGRPARVRAISRNFIGSFYPRVCDKVMGVADGKGHGLAFGVGHSELPGNGGSGAFRDSVHAQGFRV